MEINTKAVYVPPYPLRICKRKKHPPTQLIENPPIKKELAFWIFSEGKIKKKEVDMFEDSLSPWITWEWSTSTPGPLKICLLPYSQTSLCSTSSDSTNCGSCSNCSKTVVHTYWKNSAYVWTHTVKTLVVQGSTVFNLLQQVTLS